jgi:hypothetical protein
MSSIVPKILVPALTPRPIAPTPLINARFAELPSPDFHRLAVRFGAWDCGRDVQLRGPRVGGGYGGRFGEVGERVGVEGGGSGSVVGSGHVGGGGASGGIGVGEDVVGDLGES